MFEGAVHSESSKPAQSLNHFLFTLMFECLFISKDTPHRSVQTHLFCDNCLLIISKPNLPAKRERNLDKYCTMREYIHAITNHTFSKIFFLAVFVCCKHEQINLTYHQRLLPFLGTTGMNDDDDDNNGRVSYWQPHRDVIFVLLYRTTQYRGLAVMRPARHLDT